MQWRTQTARKQADRILEEEEEEDRMYFNALDNQVVPGSELISPNYLPDNAPLDAKFTLNKTVNKLQVQAKLKRHHSLCCQIVINPKCGAGNETKPTSNETH